MSYIQIDEIQFRHSGGASNTDPNASIGGVISAYEIVDATMDSMFDDLSIAEAVAGDINYRCFYIKNTNATEVLFSTVLWIDGPPGGDATMYLGCPFALGVPDPANVNTTPTAIANEATAPSGVTFIAATSEASGLIIGNLAAGDYYPFWVKRDQAANATPPALVAHFTLIAKGIS